MADQQQETGERKQLPPELWTEIGKRLETRLDILRFRSVCKLFRSNLPSPTLFPLRIPPPRSSTFSSTDSFSSSTESSKFGFFITEKTGYVIERTGYEGQRNSSSSSLSRDSDFNSDSASEPPLMVVVFEELFCEGGLCRFRPRPLFLDKNILRLCFFPSYLVPELDMSQLCVFSLFKSYQLCMALEFPMSDKCKQQEEGEFERRTSLRWGFGKATGVVKIVLISTSSINPSYAIDTSDFRYNSEEVKLYVVALFDGGGLKMLRLVSSDYSVQSTIKWKPIDSARFDDIVNHRGELFGIDYNGACFVLDFKSMKMTQIAPSPVFTDSIGRSFVLDQFRNTTQMITTPLYGFRSHPNIETAPLLGRKRLVEASGELYLLFPCRVPEQGDQSKIKIFQLRLRPPPPPPPSSSSSDQLIMRGEKWVWVEIKKLSCNQAFFVESDFSFSTLAARDILRHLGRNGNCIFLTGLSFSRYNDDCDYPLFPEMLYDSSSTGVYKLEEDDDDDSNNSSQFSTIFSSN